MTRFRFRLESVLKWRAIELETEESRLRGLLELRNRSVRAREENEAALADAERKVLAAAAVTGAELWALSGYREASRERAATLEAECRERERDAAVQREKVRDARQRCRLLERLRERRMAEWTAGNQRELDAFATEAYLARWRPD